MGPRAVARTLVADENDVDDVAGGVLVTTAKKVLLAAALLVAAGGATWFVARAVEAPPPDAGSVATLPASEAPATVPKKKRAGAGDAADERTASTSDELPPPVDLDRADRDLDLHGTVVDASCRGIPGAAVGTVTYPWRVAEVLNHADYDVEVAGPATRTARDGTFSLRLARGRSVALRVSASGFAPVEMKHVLAGERVRVTLHPGVRLVVVLRDAADAPVADARVRVFSSWDVEQGVTFVVQGVTGEAGTCEFDALPPGVRAFIAPSHPRAAGGWTRIDLPQSGELRKEIRLQPARTLTGRVIDAETKAPIAGARVGMNWTIENAVETRADGAYELTGWTGDGVSDVHVRAEGYATDGKVVGDAERVDFELDRGYAVRGRLVAEAGTPVAGANVSFIATDEDRSGQQISHGYAVTDVQGRFRVTSLRWSMRHVIVVAAPGHARMRRETPRGAPGRELDLGDVVLAEPRRVEGVVETEDGVRQQRVTVILRGPDDGENLASFYGRAVEAATDDLGRFRFADVEPGDYDVVVRPPRGEEVVKRIHVRSDADVLGVRIGRAATRAVTFVVVDPDGKPVAGAWVQVMGPGNQRIQGETDGAGRVRVEVPVGVRLRWSVHPPAAAGTVVPLSWPDLGDEESEVRVALERAVGITGRVLDESGAPVADASLEVRGGSGEPQPARTDDDGRFLALVRRGERATIAFDGTVSRDGLQVESGLTARVEGVEPGTHVVVRCTRIATDRRVVVDVVSPAGEPVPQATINAYWGNGLHRSATTDDAGRAVLADLPAREVSLHVAMRATDFVEPAPVEVVPAGQELRLVCRAATRTAGTVLSKDGSRSLGAGWARAMRRGECVAVAQVASDGRFTLLLPVGDTAPIRVEIDRGGDVVPEAVLDAVTPGTPDLRVLVRE